jgi:predicted nucleotidyltransferase
MAYTVPIRIALMIQDGVTDYVDAAEVDPARIKKYAAGFIKRGIFSGIPRSLPNRNVIRWYAVNEFLYQRFKRKMEFHFIPEGKVNGEKISGRQIRREIIENNLQIPGNVVKLLPDSTVQILEEEIQQGNIPGHRNLEVLLKRLNTAPKHQLLNIAHLNAAAVEHIIQGRWYQAENQVWASLRQADYGPVLSRLALSCVEEDVTRREIYELIMDYERQGIIPPDQTMERVIERAWYVASMVDKGLTGSEAHEKFRKGSRTTLKSPYSFDAGLHLRRFELESLKERLDAHLYVDKRGVLACELKPPGRKVKSPLKLTGKMATYLRLLIDSQVIPLQGELLKQKRGWRIRLKLG